MPRLYKYFYIKHEGGYFHPIYLPTHPKVLARRLPNRRIHPAFDLNTRDPVSPRVRLRTGILALAVFFPNGTAWDAIVKTLCTPDTNGWRTGRDFKELNKICKRS